MTRPGEEFRDVQGMIDELAADCTELAKLLHDAVAMLTELLQDRSEAAVESARNDSPAAEPGAVSADVLEIAALHAQAAGVSGEDYIRQAVLAHAARSSSTSDGDDGDDGAALRRRARDEALLVRTENEAVEAQNAHAAARAAQLDPPATEMQGAARQQRDRTAKAPGRKPG
jgi:hypothetical protein